MTYPVTLDSDTGLPLSKNSLLSMAETILEQKQEAEAQGMAKARAEVLRTHVPTAKLFAKAMQAKKKREGGEGGGKKE